MKASEERRPSEYDMLREALLNLSTIADCETPAELTVGDGDKLVLPTKESGPQLILGKKEDSNKKVEVMKNTFKYILEYIRRIYNKEKGQLSNKALLQGIQTIMVLVGEAANKLDRYTSLFQRAHGQSITDLKEYKDLQDFYINKIVKPSQEKLTLETLPSSIISKSMAREFEEDEEAIAVKSLADLDTVREDTDYELFYLSREDGTRFFTESLIREMQAACESAWHESEVYIGDDPFLQIKNWEDKQLQTLGEQSLATVRSPLEIFYHEALKHQDVDLVSYLHRGLMAVMLSSSPRNMLRHFAVKSCYQYFQDFQGFLRLAMHSQEYLKLLDRPPRKSQRFLKAAIDIVHDLCLTLYTHVPPRDEIIKGIENLVERGEKLLDKEVLKPSKKASILDHIEFDNVAIARVIKNYPNGPLFKALDLLVHEKELDVVFDPLLLGNFPCALYDLFVGGRSISLLNVPSPTTQRWIHKALINDEFKGFLRAYAERKKHHLIVNLQDRTSWKEHTRCTVLEELQRQAEFSEQVTVLTLAYDTDFYYQLAPYHHLDDAAEFLSQFYDHLTSTQTGFYFPIRAQERLFGEPLKQMLLAVQQLFFGTKARLNRRERLDYIEIFYNLLQLKVMEIAHCDSASLTSKDGIDTAAVASVELFLLLKLLTGAKISEQSQVAQMLFAPALLVRERMVDQERLLRALHMLRHIQELASSPSWKSLCAQHLKPLFDLPFLETEISIPQVDARN